MSLFPAYQDDNPSTSKPVKKEEPEDDEDTTGFNSFNIAKAAKEKEKKREREQMIKRIEEKKDKAAVKRFNLGDTSDEEEGCTMVVERSESEDENTRRIYHRDKERRREEDKLEERKRKNRERVDNKYGIRDRFKRSPSFDSDSSSRRAKRRRRKNSSSDSDSSYRRDKKYHKSEKERDRYIEPDQKYNIKQSKKNWHYLASVGVTLQNPDSYMMDDKRPDTDLRSMDKTEKGQFANYDQRFTAVLGAPFKINKLFFPAKTASRSGRVLDKPVVLREDPEWKFLTFPFNGDDFELSTVRCDKQIELSEEPTRERVAAREEMAERHKEIATASDPLRMAQKKQERLAVLKKESMDTNARLREDEKNEKLWMRLLELQVEIAALEGREASFTIDRREAILEKAIKHIPRSANLIVEVMKLKKEKNVPVEEIAKEWKMIMNRLPNSLKLWWHRLMEMTHDSKQFTRTDYIQVLVQATTDLKGLLTGTMRSHQPEPGTAEFLADLMVLRVRMEMEMGFIERAVSTVQGLIEVNVFHPPIRIKELFLAFNEVWETNLPLVGEPNGKGWFHYRKEKEHRPSREWTEEIMEASKKYRDTELIELGRAAQKEPKMAVFARHERVHEKYFWRPVRAEVGANEMEAERLVELRDLSLDYLPESRLYMVVNLIKELGGVFYGKMLPLRFDNTLMYVDPIGPQLFSFGLLNPSLHYVPEGLPRLIDRLLEQMSMDDPASGWEGLLTMSAARIRTCAWFIALRDEPFDMTAVLSELTEKAEKVVTRRLVNGPAGDMAEMGALAYLLTIYEALNLFHANIDGMNPKTLDKAIKKLVKSIVSKALVWSKGESLDRISSGLNKSVVLVLATLLVRLPGSWDERKHRVACVLLGKDGKTTELPLADQVKAQNMMHKMRHEDPAKIDEKKEKYRKWVSDFFCPDCVLAGVLECLFMFANAAKTSSEGVSTCTMKALKIVSGMYEKAISDHLDHYQQFWMYMIQLLKYGKNDFRKMWIKLMDPDTHRINNNAMLIREYIDSQQKVVSEVKMLADLKSKADTRSSLFDSLARVYAHRKQFTRIVAGAEMQSDITVASRVAKVYIDEAKRQRDPVLWRYTLNLAAQFKNRKLGEEVFTRAYADCSWSRSLHLDNMEAFPAEGSQPLLAMVEKHIRVRGGIGLIDTFIEHAKKVDGN